MSTSLKRLLDAEAARTEIPPPPVAAVVAGRQARMRRRRIIGVAVAAAVAAILAIAIPLGVTKGGSDNEPIGPVDIGWRQLDGPWTDQRSIHFGDATAPRPPGWKVDTLTSTRDSALYTAPRKDGKGDRLYELRRDGSVRQLSSHLHSLRADPTGRYVAWQDVSADEVVLVVYDAARGEVVARRPVGSLGVFLMAVDGDTVIYRSLSSPQAWVWRPYQGDPEPLDLALPKGRFVVDAGNGLLMVGGTGRPRDSYVVDGAGRRVVTLSGPTLGEFDPSGRYLALTKVSRKGQDVVGYAVRAIDASTDTELSGYEGHIVQMSWDPSGSLVLATAEQLDDGLVRPDEKLTFYRCDPATGGCVLIEGSTTTVGAVPESANLQIILPLSGMQDWTS